jgi:hypothetical protein
MTTVYVSPSLLFGFREKAIFSHAIKPVFFFKGIKRSMKMPLYVKVKQIVDFLLEKKMLKIKLEKSFYWASLPVGYMLFSRS